MKTIGIQAEIHGIIKKNKAFGQTHGGFVGELVLKDNETRKKV